MQVAENRVVATPDHGAGPFDLRRVRGRVLNSEGRGCTRTHGLGQAPVPVLAATADPSRAGAEPAQFGEVGGNLGRCRARRERPDRIGRGGAD